MTTLYSHLQSRKTVLYSRQDRIQELCDHMADASFHASERVLLALMTELSHEIHATDGIAQEIYRMETEQPFACKRSRRVEKRLAEVHAVQAEQGIYEVFTAVVKIQLLSGESICIGIHMDQQMATLAYDFIRQMGYPPSMMERFSFFDQQGYNLLLEETWKEKYGAVENIPTVYLYVHPESEQEKRNQEIKTQTLLVIHRLLEEKALRTLLTDHDLWNMFRLWLKPSQPFQESNIQEFVEAHPYLFLPLLQVSFHPSYSYLNEWDQWIAQTHS